MEDFSSIICVAAFAVSFIDCAVKVYKEAQKLSKPPPSAPLSD